MRGVASSNPRSDGILSPSDCTSSDTSANGRKSRTSSKDRNAPSERLGASSGPSTTTAQKNARFVHAAGGLVERTSSPVLRGTFRGEALIGIVESSKKIVGDGPAAADVAKVEE